jgi:hypothetical protein
LFIKEKDTIPTAIAVINKKFFFMFVDFCFMPLN